MADKTLTVDWSGLGEDEDDDNFFESCDRISSVVPLDLASSSEDEFDDSRMSFATTVSAVPTDEFRAFAAASAAAAAAATPGASSALTDDYGMWMAEPGSIQERRKRLLQGMGLSPEKEFIRLASAGFKRAASTKIGNCEVTPITVDPCPPEIVSKEAPSSSPSSTTISSSSALVPIVLVRSRSDGDIDAFSAHTKQRKEHLLGEISKQRLTRTSSSFSTPCPRVCPRMCRPDDSFRVPEKEGGVGGSDGCSDPLSSIMPKDGFGAFFLIKNLDTGKEFIVKEFNEDGMWKRFSDLQTGKQLTMEEFEKSVGYSPVVKELMRRQNVSGITEVMGGTERKASMNSYITKSFRFSKRRGVALLKNIRGVANSMSGLMSEKDREPPSLTEAKLAKTTCPDWTKVRQHGKSYKEISALRLCQEIQAHEGSIWTIRFSPDGRHLASAGEDRVIHVWEVQEVASTPLKPPDDSSVTPHHSLACGSLPPLPETPTSATERKKKGKMSSGSRKGSSIPDYIHMPETVFSLFEIPACSFKGHLDDVLDLSWSGSKLLLSSSMDKTVRLWDMETKNCLKLFAHNDYVTCIQFNPMDDKYFISGSLDGKVRIWNIPDRQVVDWTDFHEMVTAACYTPDGQGAIIGSHQGSCRMYSIDDGKLNQTSQIDLQNKKKSQTKKVTGFQFAPGNPSEVLITSADSRVRIYDGSDVIHKFMGFRNTSSQISASFSQDGKYVICASEDSQVYVWRRDEVRNVGTGKGKSLVTTRSHEHFPSRDVSVAIPWPGSVKGDRPTITVHSKRHSKRFIPQPPLSNGSTSQEDNSAESSVKAPLPPLPKKNSTLERVQSCPEEETTSCLDPGIGSSDSFSSSSASISYGESPSISASSNSLPSWSPSWSWLDGSSHGNHTVQATAWGLVVVTAGVGGEIRAYQNFGVPVRVGRQTNLFKDHS